jgi:hypothetical protein
MGPNGGSVAMDSGDWSLQKLTDLIQPMIHWKRAFLN